MLHRSHQHHKQINIDPFQATFQADDNCLTADEITHVEYSCNLNVQKYQNYDLFNLSIVTVI